MRSDSTAPGVDTNNHDALEGLSGARPYLRGFRRLSPRWGALLSLVLPAIALPALAAAADADEENNRIPEVIVTAQKKTERLQDVPIPITEVSAATLAETNQVKLQDFYTQFPGLSIQANQQSAVAFLVRGLPGAVTIDDVPISVTSYLEQAGGLSLDLDPSGLAGVEVLRGPQGTLYGANSQGGLLRYITADPRSDGINGRWEAGLSTIKNGSQPGWNFRGSVNLPVTNDLAVLVDGFGRQDPGYIDNPILGKEGVNEAHTYGGHVSMLWRPTDDFSLKLGAFIQQGKGDGTDDVNVEPGLGPYDQNYSATAGAFDRLSQLYDATLKYKIGRFELTSVTGYIWTGFRDSYDGASRGLVQYTQSGLPGTDFHGFGGTGALVSETAHATSFSQELRVSTQIGNFLDVLVGGFYNYAYGIFGEHFLSTDAQTGAVAGDFEFVDFAGASRSYAAFTNLTFHLTDQFSVQVGGRQEYDNSYSYGTGFEGVGNPLFGFTTNDQVVLPAPNGKTHKFTYLVTPQYKFSSDFMVYARLATGYAPGQANPAAPGVPATSKPDSTTDLEAGTKAEFLDHKLSLDVSVYHIKHDDIQAGLLSPTAHIYYSGNAGSATSKGLEVSTEMRPVTGLSVSAWVAYNKTEVTAVAPGSPPEYVGQPLDFSPKWSANLAIDQDFPLTAAITGFAGAKLSYVGSRFASLGGGTVAARLEFPSYVRTDLNAGVKYEDWTARLYANNVANRRGIINGGPSLLIPDSYFYITPRVIGLQISKTF